MAEPTSEAAEQQIQVLENQLQSMSEHIDDLENRGRRKNVWVIGLPEDVEGSNPTNLLGLETKAGRGKVERAHRTATATCPYQVSGLR